MVPFGRNTIGTANLFPLYRIRQVERGYHFFLKANTLAREVLNGLLCDFSQFLICRRVGVIKKRSD